MELTKIVKEFISENPNYANDINNLEIYLNSKYPETPIYDKNIFRGIDTEGILDSLKYHVEIGTFKKKEPARRYCVTVKELFLYIASKNEDYKSDKLAKEIGYSSKSPRSYQYILQNEINSCAQLKEKEPNEPIEDAEELIKYCDNDINKALISTSENTSRILFKNMVSALAVKLILYTGCTYRIVRQLHKSDYNIENNYITINGFEILLPPLFSKQFIQYIELRQRHNIGLEENFLFCDEKGKQLREKTPDSGIANYLSSRTGTGSTISISKYGIIQLLQLEVSENVISKITGASKDILESCRKSCGKSYWQAYLNSKLIQTNFYMEDFTKFHETAYSYE